MKWRSWDFAALLQQQADILAAAARLVRPGGRLVYATCSLLTAENEEVVGTFLASHADFAVAPGEAALAAHGVVIADAATPRRPPAAPATPPPHRRLLRGAARAQRPGRHRDALLTFPRARRYAMAGL
jgi:16S rRNA C967 or C1407 C5-methylase (RsmB/RsmF family)